MKPLVLLCSLLLLSGATQAQMTFSAGPRLSLNLSTAQYERTDYQTNETRSFQTDYRTGFEAGIVGNLGFGHFALQPAVLCTQKGFYIRDYYTDASAYIETTTNENYRLYYLTVPINVAYTQHADGEGFQLFAGPYVGFLLGGKYNYYNTYNISPILGPGSIFGDGKVEGSGAHNDAEANTPWSSSKDTYSRRVDAGFQAGLGYRLGAFLLQTNYSHGLLNMGVGIGGYPILTHYNRGFQASLSYLLQPSY